MNGCINNLTELIKLDYKIDIVHMDLSFNSFDIEDCMIIAEALQYNHSIYGFHFQGNYG